MGALAVMRAGRAYSADMPSRARLRLLGGGSALVALSGAWLGHAAEYARVWGFRGAIAVLFGSVHGYMLPLAAMLIVAAAMSSVHVVRLWKRLGRILDLRRGQVRAALRGHRVRGIPCSSVPSAPSTVLLAWPLLTAVQALIYLVQENVEAVGAGLPAPGLAAVNGIHSLAIAVHAAVALVLLLVIAAVVACFRRRAVAIRAVERLLRRLLSDRGNRSTSLGSSIATPLRRLGSHCWRRPPPLLAAH
jgi:hypothetical protein